MTQCPRCSGSNTAFSKEGASFWVCERCQIAYLDRDSLSSPAFWSYRLLRSTATADPCPNCSVRMQHSTLVGPSAVLRMDYCGPCKLAMSTPKAVIQFLRAHSPDRIQMEIHLSHEQPTTQEYIEVDERDRAFAFFFQVPIELSRNVRKAPPMTILLICTCLVAYALEILLGAEFIASFGLATETFTWATLLTMLTSCFLHGDLLHLGGNVYFLYAFGRLLEDRLGEVGLLVLFILAGYLSSLGFFLAHIGEETFSIGASGAISGILGAYFLLYPLRMIGYSIYFTVIRIPAVLYLGLWFLCQCLLMDEPDDIAYGAHVWGFVAGMCLGLLIRTNFLGLNGLLIRLPDLSDLWLKAR